MDQKKLLPSDTFEELGKRDGALMLGAGYELTEYAKEKGVEDEVIKPGVKTLRDYVVLVGASRAR